MTGRLFFRDVGSTTPVVPWNLQRLRVRAQKQVPASGSRYGGKCFANANTKHGYETTFIAVEMFSGDINQQAPQEHESMEYTESIRACAPAGGSGRQTGK